MCRSSGLLSVNTAQGRVRKCSIPVFSIRHSIYSIIGCQGGTKVSIVTRILRTCLGHPSGGVSLLVSCTSGLEVHGALGRCLRT